MDVRTKRRRRVAILLAAIVLLAGGTVGLYYFQNWRNESQARQHRRLGLEAFAAGDHDDAAEQLYAYLRRHSDDAEALYPYAKAILKTPEPDYRHLLKAERALIQVVRIQPEHEGAIRDLLDLYLVLERYQKALETAEQLLAINGEDLAALHGKAIALARLDRHEDALAAARTCLAADPLHFQVQVVALQMKHQLGHPTQNLIDHADQVRNEHPQDPRFELLQAIACGLAEEYDQSVRWLRAAASRTVPDEAFAATLVRFLDEAQLFTESLAVLSRSSIKHGQFGLYGEAARRLFEAERFEDAADRVEALELAGIEAKTELLGIRAMCLYQLDRETEAAAATAGLAAGTDPRSPAWATVIEAATGEARPSVVIEACRQALATAPHNPYFNALLGNAYVEMSEHERAISAWRRAAEQRPTWAAPRRQAALAFLSVGKADEALEMAHEAIVRQPDSVDAAVAYALSRAANLPDSQTDSAAALLELVNEIQRVVPGEEQTLVLRVSLLAQEGQRDAAAGAVEAALASARPLSEQAYLELAQTSRELDLGLESACLQRIESLLGLTPNLAVERASALARSGKPQEGLRLLESARQGARPSDEAEWRIALATYLDAVEDPRARALWIKLADERPDNASLQWLVVRAQSVQTDRQFTARVIERLRTLSGPKAVNWQIERARWLLGSPDPRRGAADAATLLREVITEVPLRAEPRLLLAQSLEQLGRLPVAIRELTEADQVIVASNPIRLELARLHQTLRQFSSALEQLERLITDPAARPGELRRAAAMLARQAEDEKAIAALEALRQNEADPKINDALLLAMLNRRVNRLPQAEAICRELMERPTLIAIAFTADFYAAQGRSREAEQALAHLDHVDTPPGARQTILSDHYARYGTAEQTLEQLRAAVTAVPTSPTTWQRLIAYQLMIANTDDAIATIAEARQALPQDPGLALVGEKAELVKSLHDSPHARPLVVALVTEPENGPAAAAALGMLAQAVDPPDAGSALADQMRRLADEHPDFLALQILSAWLFLDIGLPDPALQIATRAMRRFPTSVEPAWLAAEAFAASDRWFDALAAATQWRRRAARGLFGADMMIAEAKLQLGQATSALEMIAPYIDRALADADAYPLVITRYVRSLIASRRLGEAAEVLMPLLADSSQWRLATMRLAALAVDHPGVATTWLGRVEAKTPAHAVDERLVLAQSWWALALRLNKPGYRRDARRIMTDLILRPAATGMSWHLSAVMAEEDGDLATARQHYRTAVQLDPQLHLSLNNLAMLLAAESEDLSEALDLARRAVAARPGDANYLDTLAQVQAQVNQFEQAIATTNSAIELDPDNPQWQQNLAQILMACGRQEEAENLLKKLRMRHPDLR